MPEKVMIAMSGGVDSSVTAHILKKEGYICAGATMLLCEKKTQLAEDKDVGDAKSVCDALGMDFNVFEKRDEFKENVIKNFIESYVSGLTPNPCIVCNQTMKFGSFLKSARELGFNTIATGHYARIRKNNQTGRYELLRAKDLSKDQSYVLYFLSQEQLKHTLFPLGDYTKAEIREIAEKNGFVNAEKKDSQDICFVPDGDYAAIIKNNFKGELPAGDFTDINGTVLGKHKGIINYTIGQRKGLGIALGKPQFVISKNALDNTVVLADECELFYKKVLVKDVNFISVSDLPSPVNAQVKLRYSAAPQPAVIRKLESGKVLVEFEQPQRAPSPGQAAVFYCEDVVLGGGTIEKGER